MEDEATCYVDDTQMSDSKYMWHLSSSIQYLDINSTEWIWIFLVFLEMGRRKTVACNKKFSLTGHSKLEVADTKFYLNLKSKLFHVICLEIQWMNILNMILFIKCLC